MATDSIQQAMASDVYQHLSSISAKDSNTGSYQEALTIPWQALWMMYLFH
jgi:hypothetical protein